MQTQNAACVIDNGAMLGAGKIPFLGIDQGGGANIAGSNIMVGGMGGQEDFLDADGYNKLGLPNAILPQTVGVDRTFGIAMHPDSALLRGMLDKTSAATRANVNGTVIPARSENDTGNNPHNPVYGIARAGANGEFAATIGTRNSESGGRSRAPDSMIEASLRPVRVSNPNEAIGLGGGDNGGFPDGRVAEASAIISALKLGKISEQQATKDLLQCGDILAELVILGRSITAHKSILIPGHVHLGYAFMLDAKTLHRHGVQDFIGQHNPFEPGWGQFA